MDYKRKAKELHDAIFVMDGHSHLMLDVEKKRAMGEKAVFSKYYAPLCKAGGVNMLTIVIGADSPNCCAHSDLLLWGTLRIMNMLLMEAVESADTLALCTTYAQIKRAIGDGKIAAIMSIEGARPLEGKPNLDTLDSLQMLYRLGLRQVQMCDMGRGRVGDGVSAYRTKSKLTPFGIEMVKECNRLGMIIDTVHMNDEGFRDVIETSAMPIIDSHSSCSAVAEWGHNVSDERIRAIAQNGGILGISCYDLSVGGQDAIDNGYRPTVEDQINHIDHLVEVGGIDHVGIGSDHMPYDVYGETRVVDHCFYPIPGYMEGVVKIGVRDSYYVEGIDNTSGFRLITEGLVKRGYNDEDIAKIMGGNYLRIYNRILQKDSIV